MSSYPAALRAARFGIVLILVCGGQIAARAGALRAAAGDVLNVFLLASYVALLARGLIWVAVLRGERLSIAYPVLALAYPLVLALSAWLFGEAVSAGKIAGTALIVAGVALVVAGEKQS